MRYQIQDLDIKEISFVDKPANQRKYIFVKRDEGGEKKMDLVKLESLNYEDRRKLEIEVEARLLPDLKKKFDETYRLEFEKSFTEEKIQTIKTGLRTELERAIREEYSKQDAGVSQEAADTIKTALTEIIRGTAEIGNLVGYGYKQSVAADEVKRADLEKSITELKDNLITEDDLKKLVE